MNVMSAWDVHTMLELVAPGIQHRFITYDAGPDRVALMAHPDGSWARAEQVGGRVVVHQGGPRRLHNLLNQARALAHVSRIAHPGYATPIDPEGAITPSRDTRLGCGAVHDSLMVECRRVVEV